MMDFNNNEHLTDEQISLKEKIKIDITEKKAKSLKTYGQMSTQPAHSTIEEFIDAVQEAVNLDQVNASQRVILKDKHAAGNIFEDPQDASADVSGVILYSMKKRAPGTMKGGNSPFDEGRRELQPRIRDVISESLETPGEATVLYGQWFDNLICFEIAARTAHRANELALWFEEVMECNRYYFAGKGIHRYFFHERDEDKHQQIGNESVFYRPMVYYVRTEKSYKLSERALNNIVVCLTSKE